MTKEVVKDREGKTVGMYVCMYVCMYVYVCMHDKCNCSAPTFLSLRAGQC